MADWADDASKNEQFRLELALKKAGQKPRLTPKGCCHNCDEPIDGDLLFCDADCRDDWDKEQKARDRNGGYDTAPK